MTVVFFRARAQFTGPINRDFWRKLREHIAPFHNLTALGGVRNGHFQGTLTVDIESREEEALAFEITSAIVQKVELLSKVGVANVEFDEITLGVG